MGKISSKHQITLTAEAFAAARLAVGDEVRAVAVGPGKVLIERVQSPVETFAGALTDAYADVGPEFGLEALRDEWAD